MDDDDLVCHACDGTGGDCVHGMCWECAGSGMVGNLGREYAEYARQAWEEDEAARKGADHAIWTPATEQSTDLLGIAVAISVPVYVQTLPPKDIGGVSGAAASSVGTEAGTASIRMGALEGSEYDR